VPAHPAAAQTTGAWQVVPSPNDGPQVGGNTLLAVEAISPTDAWAVGFHYSATFCTTCPDPLVIHWNGAQWSLVQTPTIAIPKVQLNGVSAASSSDVWAVGYSYNPDCGLCAQTLIQHWDGSSWSVVPSPNPGISNELRAVDALSAADVWAVGSQWVDQSMTGPLVVHFDGVGWSAHDLSQFPRAQLNAVDAIAPTDVWAVGAGIALHWDGSSWSSVPVSADEYVVLTGVSGVASDDVWAVGNAQYSSQSGHTLSSSRAFHWDGTSWTRVLYPGLGGQDSRTYGVHATSTNDVWAVGGQPGAPGSGVAFEYTTARWDGTQWRTVDTPNQGVLYAISASSPTDAWAVGFGFDSLGFSTGTYTLHFTAPCGSADFDCDGDTGTDADMDAFFAGNCPAAPCTSSADFDGDGDSATDADIEAFFRVLAGGPC
jgi:hypothetical protein